MKNANRPTDAVTLQLWTALAAMYEYFNAVLFDGALLPVVLNFSRHANSYGFFAPERWVSGEGEMSTHEISINPSHLSERPLRATASTLVHEMAHAWQHEHGTPGKRGYHNEQWAAKMDELGLAPSSTAAPGGARTGYRMSHYIVDGGAFDRAFAAMPERCKLPWLCIEPSLLVPPAGPGGATGPGGAAKRPAKPVSKLKYTCPGCNLNVWGKPGLKVRCEDCDERLVPQGADADRTTRRGPEVDRELLAAACGLIAADLLRAGRDLDTVPAAELAERLFSVLNDADRLVAALRAPRTDAGARLTARVLGGIGARA